MFCDGHLHTTHHPLADLTPGGIYLSCSASPSDWPDLLKTREITPFLGIHPEKITPDWKDNLEEMDQLLIRNPRAQVGECGLDSRFYRTHSRKLQEELLKGQLDLAVKYCRAIALHQVGASGALADFIAGEKPDIPILIHGFHGSREMMRRFLKLGLHISIGPGSHWESSEFIEQVKEIPFERLLLETDWPYVREAGKKPYSEWIDSYYEFASVKLGIDKDELTGIVSRNGEIFTH